LKFARILVPLDGSRLAEAALPLAEAFARGLGSELVLVHVLEEDPPVAVHGEPHLRTLESARAYLAAQRSRLVTVGLEVEAHVRRGDEEDVARSIEELAAAFDADVVSMCAHGRQTLRGRMIGPVAQRALGDGSTPILLRTAGADVDVPFELRRVLVPIDFRHDLEPALDATRALCLAFEATATLMNVSEPGTDTRSWLLPSAGELTRTHEAEDAAERLRGLAERLARDGLETEVVVREEDAAEAIVIEARLLEADLVVLVSHGRSGVAAWYERSIGGHLISAPGLNLLLIRER
jgi:nucleotide-binding universal stress UspA family protein